MRPAIIVMVKAPRAGRVKTRLVPTLSAYQAAALAACFARDAVSNMQRIKPDTIIAYAPAEGRAIIENILSENILPANLLYVEQRGSDLGARLVSVAADVHARGFSPLIFIGTDSPTLPVSFIEDAIRALVKDQADITLGGTDDGGYYAIGMRRPYPTLFDDVAWSSSHVFNQTVANITRLNLRLYEMPRWYDVDEAPDLARLCVELDASEDARLRAPVTYCWLAKHRESEDTDDR